MARRPDIILLILDTQRSDRLSCYGYDRPTSPHLDAFAEDATLFRHAYSTAQWTVPSHASMFTGVYPGVHRTQQSHDMLPAALPTLAERLRDDGYFTAAFCNNPLVGVVNNGLRRGFTSFLNYSGLLTSRPNQAGAKPDAWSRYRQFFKRHVATSLHKVQDAFARSDALLSFAFTPFMVPIWQTALSFKGNTAKSLSDAARLLTERKGIEKDQPVFCFINLMGTHMPFHPDRDEIRTYAPSVLSDRKAQSYVKRFNGDVLGWLTPLADSMSEDEKAVLNGMYDAEVATQDLQLGRFFQELRASGALDQSLVMVAADHGEHLGEKHFVGHTVSLYHELTHVPLIVRDPDGAFSRGDQRQDNVSGRRIFHTALEAAGSATPAEARHALDRNGDDDPDGGVVFAEAITSENVLNLIRRNNPEVVERYHVDQRRLAVWQDGFKFIQTGPKQQELFDVSADPDEHRNLVQDKRALAGELRSVIQQHVADTAASAATPGQQNDGDADPMLQERLRALGYLE